MWRTISLWWVKFEGNVVVDCCIFNLHCKHQVRGRKSWYRFQTRALKKFQYGVILCLSSPRTQWWGVVTKIDIQETIIWKLEQGEIFLSISTCHFLSFRDSKDQFPRLISNEWVGSKESLVTYCNLKIACFYFVLLNYALFPSQIILNMIFKPYLYVTA